MPFISTQEKFFSDLNPRCFNHQKTDHVKTVFNKLDKFLVSNFGFNTNDSIIFVNLIIKSLGKLANEKRKLAIEKYDQAINDYNDPEKVRPRKSIKEKEYSAKKKCICLCRNIAS